MQALNLSLSLVSELPWVGFPITGQHKVLYLQMEIPHPLLHKRMSQMYRGWTDLYPNGASIKDKFYVWTEPFLKLDTPIGFRLLDGVLDRLRPTVVLIDPLYKALTGNILDPNSVRIFVDSLDGLIAKYEFSLVLFHHTRKGTLDEQADLGTTEDMLGSAVFSWWADTIIKVTKKGEKDRKVRLQLNFDVVRHAEDLIEPREVIFDRSDLMFYLAENVIQV